MRSPENEHTQVPCRIKPGATQSRFPGKDLAAALLAGVLTLVVFSPVLWHGFIDPWDDAEAITENADYNPPRLSHLLHYWVPPPKREFYVPLTYSLWGLLAMGARHTAADGKVVFNAAWFHAANLLAHAISAALVFLILKRLVGPRWAAWVGAMVFAVHPIQVEAVAWAASMYTPLSGMFALLAAWQYLRFSDARAERAPGAWGHYAVATIAFVLGMLTKPSIVAVPLIVAALEMGLRRRPLRQIALPLGAWVMIGIAIVQATRIALPGTSLPAPDGPQRVIVALDAIAFYLGKLAWPARLIPDYGRSPRWVMGHPLVWLAAVAPIGLLVVCRLWWKRARWPGTAAAVCALALLPTLGLVPFDYQRYSTVADRYAYLAMLAPGIAVAVLLCRFAGRTAFATAVVLLSALAAMSVAQLRYWKDPWTLFDRTLNVNPASLAANNAFRYLLVMHADDAPHPCTLSAAQLVEVGDRLLREHRPQTSAAAYRLAIQRGADDAPTWDKLALALIDIEDLSGAAGACRQALRRNCDDAEAQTRLNQLLDRLGSVSKPIGPATRPS